MADDDARFVEIWHEGKHVQKLVLSKANTTWRDVSVEGAPLRVRVPDEGAGILVDVAGIEPVDVYVSPEGLFVPMERPVWLDLPALIVIGPGACGTWAVSWHENDYGPSFTLPMSPVRAPRDNDARGPLIRRLKKGDDTQIDAHVRVVMPDGRGFLASMEPLTDDDVCAWVDGANISPPPRWPNRYGPFAAVGLDAAEAAACAHFHGGRLPTEEEWEALASIDAVHIGDAWEWTSTQRKGGGQVVRGGRYRDRRDVCGTVASRAWETEGARDVVVRVVRDLDL